LNVNPFIESIFRYSQYFLFFAALGGILGLLVGVVIGHLIAKGGKKDSIEKITPKELSDYYSDKSQYGNYYGNDDIPRSMKDYFNEMKPRR